MFRENNNDKFSFRFWNKFSGKKHYFHGLASLQELKLTGYCNFFKDIELENSRILKTDLYVEAKNKSDNFLPRLKIRQCIGIDLSFPIVKEARENLAKVFPDMQFIVADVRRLPFKEAAFGAIISDSTLDHLIPKDLAAALDELKRVARPKGKLVLSLNNIFNLPFTLDRYIKNLFPKSYFSLCFSLRQAISLLSQAGFQAIKHDYMMPLDHLSLFLLKLSQRLTIFSAFAYQWFNLVSKAGRIHCLKPFFCLQFIILAENHCPPASE